MPHKLLHLDLFLKICAVNFNAQAILFPMKPLTDLTWQSRGEEKELMILIKSKNLREVECIKKINEY